MRSGLNPQLFFAATASTIALIASPATAQSQDDDAIVVTGSRIAKSEFTSACLLYTSPSPRDRG